MLPLPLDEVRQRLQIAAPVPYRRMGFEEFGAIRKSSPVFRVLQAILPAGT